MFTGFPPQALMFYDELELNNSKEYWAAHKQTYSDSVREPMLALCDDLADEFGEAKIFRPHRDVRFSADKSPYKTHQGAYVPAGPALGWYVEVSATGVLAGAGFYQAESAALKNLRRRIDSPAGAELERLVTELSDDGWHLGGDAVRTAPRGYPKDHPRIGLLRHKTIVLSHDYGDEAIIHSADLLDQVRADWRRATPLVTWLADTLSDTAP
ncbi:MAG: DUF2461 domain-containing protein [Beutenbergiaceae bacterium]